MQIVRCARGEDGPAPIRGGRRRVALGPVGALAFFFTPRLLAAESPLAVTAVRTPTALEERARATLEALRDPTELDFERERAAEG